MVDVGEKPDTERVAIAQGFVTIKAETLRLIQENALKKGDVVTIAEIAGVMGAKKTSELIPLCHPIALTQCKVVVTIDAPNQRLVVRATARTIGKTGVEMEALTAVSVAALTIYDMAKAVDREMTISDIRLLEKHGGQHGDYVAKDTP
jgi:cyclic pyranopterin phosphate synthase